MSVETIPKVDQRAGINTFDTGPEECGYGPSEKIIGSVPGQSASLLFESFMILWGSFTTSS